MKKHITALALCFIANFSYAEGWNNWKRYKVGQIIFESASDASETTIRVTPQLTTAETSCTESGYLQLDASTQKGQYIISVLLSAQARQSEFHLGIDGCIGDRPKLTGIWTLN